MTDLLWHPEKQHHIENKTKSVVVAGRKRSEDDVPIVQTMKQTSMPTTLFVAETEEQSSPHPQNKSDSKDETQALEHVYIPPNEREAVIAGTLRLDQVEGAIVTRGSMKQYKAVVTDSAMKRSSSQENIAMKKGSLGETAIGRLVLKEFSEGLL
jgi:hypothetical protein